MFTQTLRAALLSGLILGAAASSTLAMDGGGGGGGGGNDNGFITLTHPTGKSATRHFHRDRSHVTIFRDRDGTVTGVDAKGPPKAKPVRAPKPKPARAPKPRGRSWASSTDPFTGEHKTSIGNGNGTRTVITISPFGGLGIHILR